MDEPASKARLADIHVVTEEDLANGTYTIEDVVLPLPGSQIKYPAHSTAEVCIWVSVVQICWRIHRDGTSFPWVLSSELLKMLGLDCPFVSVDDDNPDNSLNGCSVEQMAEHHSMICCHDQSNPVRVTGLETHAAFLQPLLSSQTMILCGYTGYKHQTCQYL